MNFPRVCFPVLSILLSAALPAAAQSVVSTHAGVVHYFEGAVSIGGTPLQPQFGRFPEIADGAELRTAEGRAEVLLGPGVILRVAENSAIMMLSSVLTDTRLEMLSGTAILESKDALPGNSLAVIYKDWEMRIPTQGVYRIDSKPEQLRVYNGEVQVRTAQSAPVIVRAGQTLPLAAVLVPDETMGAPGDEFNSWAFDRSEAVAADNAMASQIVDDPTLYPDLAYGDGLAMASYTYFPSTMGSPYLGYGVSIPYMGSYFGYVYAPRTGYAIRPTYPALPVGGIRLPIQPRYPTVGGYRPGISVPLRPTAAPPSIPHSAPIVVHGGHR